MSRPLDLAAVFVASLSLCLLACSENNTDGGGSAGGSGGGSAGSTTSGGGGQGGDTASSSARASGGSASSGGAGGSSKASMASGGSTALGGSTAGGATLSSAGAGSGGRSAGGGTTVTGGNTGSGGGPGGTKASGGATGGATGTAGGGSGGRTATASGTGGATSPGGSTGAAGATAAGGAPATVDCTDVSTTPKNFTKQYEDGSLAVTGSTKTYWTMTNWWHKFGGQTVSLNGLSMKLGNTQNASVPASDGNPMGFPTIFIGTYQNKATVGSNLPKKVSDIKSVPTVFQTNASSLDTANLNAAYDVWFTATGDPLSSARASNPGAGGAYLMVWMFKPEERQPRGGVRGTTGTVPNFPATTVDGVAGKWDVWVDKTDPLCISYVATDAIDGLDFDLNKFIQDSVTNQYGITSSMYLSLIFGGFEVWSGGDGLELKKFCAAVN